VIERHKLSEDAAPSPMSGEARRLNCRAVDLAKAVLGGHSLLPPGLLSRSRHRRVKRW